MTSRTLLNSRTRRIKTEAVRKSVKIPELLSSPSVKETFDPEILKYSEFHRRSIKTECVLIVVQRFCFFHPRKSQFGLMFQSIKVCSKSILVRECDSRPPKVSVDPQQEHDLRKCVLKL